MEPEPKRQLSIDDAHTPAQFAEWLQVTEDWVRDRLGTLPGVIAESRNVVRIIPRYYMSERLKRGSYR